MTRDLLVVQLPLLEKVLRTIAVYLFLVLALRLAGKRELAQLNSFDLVVLLLLSNTVQNAIIGPDNSLLGACSVRRCCWPPLHHRAAWVPAPGAGTGPGGHADYAGAGRQDAGRQPAPLPDHQGGADGGDPPPGGPQPPRP
jgi:hypothetical protein